MSKVRNDLEMKVCPCGMRYVSKEMHNILIDKKPLSKYRKYDHSTRIMKQEVSMRITK